MNNSLKYHVVVEVDPNDCMGHHVKDNVFDSVTDAKKAYDNCLSDKNSIRKEMEEVFSFPDYCNYCSTDDGIVDDSLLIQGTITLVQFDNKKDEDSAFSFVDDIADFSYNTWLNDFDELTYSDGSTSLVEVFENHGAKTLLQNNFEIIITPNNLSIRIEN